MQIVIFTLFFFTFICRYLFWSYVFQLKEYRFDRLKEYMQTPQWKRALFSKIFFLEISLFLVFCLSFLVSYLFNNIIFSVICYWILLLYFIIIWFFYMWKIWLRKVIHPKNTQRQLVLYFLSFLILFLIFWSFYLFDSIESIFSYFVIFFLLIFPYLIIFISNFLILPLVNYQREKIINNAKMKSKNNKNTIKIWVTWSFWKSSVKEYLSFLLWNIWKTLSTPENINTEMWVSNIILQKLDEGFEYFVAEMWAYKVWEIKTLWEIVNHKYWFLTAIWTQHIWLFWSQENIIKGKSEIALKVLENDGVLYVNWDNENIKKTNFDKKLKLVKYWITNKNDAKSEIIWYNEGFLEFRFVYKEKDILLKTNLLWDHNILNITWVLAFLTDLWIDFDLIKDSLLKLPKPKHTLDVIKNKDFTIIDDTYNLSIDGLFAWIDTLNIFQWEKILILDDILELWKDSKKIHFELWEKLWKSWKIDKFLYVWENYKKEFIDWLISSWFDKESILKDLLNISEKWILLFEGRKAKKYIDFK